MTASTRLSCGSQNELSWVETPFAISAPFIPSSFQLWKTKPSSVGRRKNNNCELWKGHNWIARTHSTLGTVYNENGCGTKRFWRKWKRLACLGEGEGDRIPIQCHLCLLPHSYCVLNIILPHCICVYDKHSSWYSSLRFSHIDQLG